jgi:membrane-associated phospholipid phosphatase
MINQIVKTFDTIGFYGPLIVMGLIIIDLFSQPKYNWIYVVFVVVNEFVNRGLKLMVREPRPDGRIPFSDHESYTGASKYGMPSGHAQSIGFSLMYLWLVRTMDASWIICSFIGALTLYQRWKYRNHSIIQLLVGLLCGCGFGWVVWWAGNKYFRLL